MSKVFNYIKNSKLVQKMKCLIISKSPILIILLLFICIYLIITYKAYSADGIGSIVAATIAVLGVYYTAMENKKKTYKEIVTRERIEWLRDLKNNFSEYLALTNYGYVPSKDIDRVRELYNKIIFNINSVNDIEALNAIKIYNDYVFATRHEDSREIRKYSIKINSADKEENFSCSIYVSNYKFLKNNMEEKFRAIFKGTWTFIKGEAD
ncbi:hypothetical protein HMPREF3229_01782 [Peptoniphilus harei]|uniref:Uncharacterized protein n=1 Tax=Peptoniphilus harei TaxID=54005 RepID=A0A133PI23_9FIRM|nr:hypothetical protein [Peptoniphilus harei]KXA28197.1 hypothetical protein HMPREF3229_01782 [Peptoniphilus harei]